MNLPDVITLNQFNKILISYITLAQSANSCHKESLINHCSTVAMGALIDDYNSVLENCVQSGLLKMNKEQVIISALGERFLAANHMRYYEITESQKEIISEKMLLKGVWSHHSREFLSTFASNFDKGTYELVFANLDGPLPTKFNSLIQLLKYLGVLFEEDERFSVSKKYVELVYQLTADGKAITEVELEKIWMENRRLGAQAEMMVVRYEENRLKALGKFTQAALVNRISTINRNAGYDIESFSGDNDSLNPDRFIEVKASQGEAIRFYWSINEINVAKQMKSKYWIYFLKEFSENNPDKSIPLMIQKPLSAIKKNKSLSMDATNYLILGNDAKTKLESLAGVQWLSLA